MAYNIVWSMEANEDLYGYLENLEQQENKPFIQGLLTALSRLMKLIEKMPHLHPIWQDDVRIAQLPNKVPYTVYYRTNDADKTILVIGILYQAQDNSKMSARY